MKKVTFIRALRVITRAALFIDRHLVKKYLNIETPLYRLWWELHVVEMQRRLNKGL